MTAFVYEGRIRIVAGRYEAEHRVASRVSRSLRVEPSVG